MICLLCMKQYKQALERLDFLIDTIPKKYAQQLWLIRGHLNSLLASSENNQNVYSTKSKDDLRRALKYDPENY